MNVTIITYDTAHAKTAAIFAGLSTRPDMHIGFLLVPFSKRPERDVLIRHRPDQFVGPGMREIASRSDARIWEYEDRATAVAASDYLLIGGANLLEPELANCGKIINGHAGLIPLVRGLDSFKWAIRDGRPVGNTLHFIDAEADAGSIIHQEITPLEAGDSIDSFARRHYQIEIELLAGFPDYLSRGQKLDYPATEARKRMPKAIEQEMLASFPAYRAKFAAATPA